MNRQRVDGKWADAQALKGTRLFRVEQWCNAHHLRPIGRVLAWWDELWLG